MSNSAAIGWLSGDGPSSGVVFSSRIRVARNLNGYPFPHRADEMVRREILNQVSAAAKTDPALEILKFVQLEELPAADQHVLIENHLISPYFIQDVKGRAILINDEQTVSVMINEEDHLRLQCMMSGLDLEKSWGIVSKVDDALEAKLPYAFSEQWGYLVACPTNLGTGLRASALLHLPGLTLLQLLPGLIQSLNQAGLVVRGFYGEGTESQGHFFQVSNAFSLGPTEEDIISRISSIAGMVVSQETEARERLKRENGKIIEDRVWRAFSSLKHARIMNSNEAMEQLSLTRLGVQLGLLPEMPMGVLNELVVMTRPANLLKRFGDGDAEKRDVMRADYLRSRLQNFN